MSTALFILGAAATAGLGAAAVIAASKRKELMHELDLPAPGNEPHAKCSAWPKPIVVGHPGKNTEVDAELALMAKVFEAYGVDLSMVTPREVTTMPKAPGGPVAIPPRMYWPAMAMTLVHGFMPLRKQLGAPISLRGYRPQDYNAAVGGTKCSRHQGFDAIDMRAGAKTKALALLAAEMFIQHGAEYRMGLGVYGWPNPSVVHIDLFGRDKPAKWEQAALAIAAVKEAA